MLLVECKDMKISGPLKEWIRYNQMKLTLINVGLV